jgi:hypothetical protein
MLIYVQHMQCAGCQVYHKFVDNLGLVEYDLREENGIHEENVVATDSEDWSDMRSHTGMQNAL